MKAIIILLAIALLFLLKIRLSVSYNEKISVIVSIIGIEKNIKFKPSGKSHDIKAVIKAAGLLKKYAVIEKISIIYTIAGSEPFEAVRNYTYVKVLSELFNKKTDIETQIDYPADKSKLIFNSALSIRIWQVVYILIQIKRSNYGKQTERNYGNSHGQYKETG